MRVMKIGELPAEKRSGGIFLGTVESRSLVGESIGAKDLKLDIISFPPGVKNKPHKHTYDQVLYILEGEGIVATEKEQKIVAPGMIAFIPRGELHWHGATEKSPFQHISILRPGDTKY
jgi:quercetin dioxygenase-like cupin family protein